MRETEKYIRGNQIKTLKSGVLSRFPLLGTTMSGVEFEEDYSIKTACTDGSKVMYNPNFLDTLTYEQKLFTLAHEIMHIAFEHIPRCVDKNEMQLWNIATDAVINQMLAEEGLPIKEGFVNLPEAKGKSAEYMYKLIKNNKDKYKDLIEKMKQSMGQSGSPMGEHGGWKKAATNQPQQGQPTNQSANEENFSQNNSDKKNELAKSAKDAIRTGGANGGGKNGGNNKFTTHFDGIPEGESVVSWKKLLKREIEKEEYNWSYRRADEDNYWQARIMGESVYRESKAQVLLDTSVSVSDSLLRAFLIQLKPLLRESKMEVGCFDHRFFGFTTIKSKKDIDNFKIEGRGCTDFNLALKSFSTEKDIHRIIFTDGFDIVTDNEYNRKLKNVIWLVWENKHFKPCVGKVIFIDVNKMQSIIEDAKAIYGECEM